MEKVLELYKKEGETPLETIERFRLESPEYKDEKMTYAGRLDPMAEGILLVLVGDECKNKDKYLGLDKEYEFEILWGFETDTYDILGIPKKSGECDSPLFEQKYFLGLLKDLVGGFKQKYPPYSSMTVEGKQLFQWAREGRLDKIEIPEREVEVYNVEFLGQREINGEELLKNIQERVGLVKGDFRQKEILEKWEKILSENREVHFPISKLKIKCSSGTYVRGIAHDLGQKLGIGALAYSIKRTKIVGK